MRTIYISKNWNVRPQVEQAWNKIIDQLSADQFFIDALVQLKSISSDQTQITLNKARFHSDISLGGSGKAEIVIVDSTDQLISARATFDEIPSYNDVLNYLIYISFTDPLLERQTPDKNPKAPSAGGIGSGTNFLSVPPVLLNLLASLGIGLLAWYILIPVLTKVFNSQRKKQLSS